MGVLGSCQKPAESVGAKLLKGWAGMWQLTLPDTGVFGKNREPTEQAQLPQKIP
jgi:hypothetical protein